MTEEELIRIAVKVILITTNAKKDYEETIDPESGVALGPRSRDELGRTKEAAKIDRLETIIEKHIIKSGIDLKSLEDKMNVEWEIDPNKINASNNKDIGTLAVQIGNINTRLSNLEKKNFEILPEKKKSKKGQDKVSKKRGPYKKKTVVKPVKTETKPEPQNDLGTKTITKYLTKINNVLNHSKNFTKDVIIAELRDKVKGGQLAKLGGKATLKEVKKAKWRLDARRRRDAKIGIYGQKDYWKRKKKK